MEEMLKFLQEGIDREVEQKNRNKELNILGIMSDGEVERLNAIHDYTITRINKIHVEVYKKYNEKSESAK